MVREDRAMPQNKKRKAKRSSSPFGVKFNFKAPKFNLGGFR